MRLEKTMELAVRQVRCRCFMLRLALSIDPTCQKSAVHDDHLTGDEASGIRCQKDRRAGQLLDLSETIHRRTHEKLAPAFATVEEGPIELRAKHAGGDRIDADVLRWPFDGQRF